MQMTMECIVSKTRKTTSFSRSGSFGRITTLSSVWKETRSKMNHFQEPYLSSCFSFLTPRRPPSPWRNRFLSTPELLFYPFSLIHSVPTVIASMFPFPPPPSASWSATTRRPPTRRTATRAALPSPSTPLLSNPTPPSPTASSSTAQPTPPSHTASSHDCSARTSPPSKNSITPS